MYELSRANYELLEFDIIMPVFSVVIESYALGCNVDWGKPDLMPYIKGKIWKEYKDIDIKKDFISNHAISAVIKCISKLKKKYPHVAIAGKAFGPWSLGYHLFCISEFLIKTIDDPSEVKDILKKLSEIAILFTNAQVDAGADLITVPDHATQDLCSPLNYKEFLVPIHSMFAEQIKAPVILHICGNTTDRIEYICSTKVSGFHFESKVDACVASQINNNRIALCGNINNPVTILSKGPDEVKREVERAILCGLKIIGPECAVPLKALIRNLKAIADTVRESTLK